MTVQTNPVQTKVPSAGLSDPRRFPTLRMGDSDQAVEFLQQRLSNYVAPLPVSGRFDEATDHAVRAFQYRMFLVEDGVVGLKTWQSVLSLAPNADLPVLRLGAEGRAVIWLQQILARVGAYRAADSAASIDGVFGLGTKAAVEKYQSQQRQPALSVDGIVGRRTWWALSQDRLQAANYSINNIRLHKRSQAHSGSITAIATTQRFSNIFSGSWDTLVQAWGEDGDKLGNPILGDGGSVSDVVINPTTLDVISSTFGGTIRTSPVRRRTDSTTERFPGRGSSINAVDISADGRYIAAGNNDDSLRLFDTKGKLLGEVNAHEGNVTDVAFNPRTERFGRDVVSVDTTGKVVASLLVFSDGRLDVGLRTSKVLAEAGSSTRKPAIAISNSGYYIAVTTGSVLRIFSSLGGLLYSAEYETGLNDVSFSPCGRYLALACLDNSVRVLDLFPRSLDESDIFVPTFTLSGHSASVESVAFSQEGSHLYSGAHDGELITWRIER